MSELTVLSSGWGVQSWTLSAMVALGELPMVDFVIHSDTTWEREATYRFAEQWTPWLEERGVRVVTTADTKAASQVNMPKGAVLAPVYTLGKNGKAGQLRRTCTQRWKIAPLRRYVSSELKARGLSKSRGAVEVWLGISKDEFHRAKDSTVKYMVNRYPLLELGMTRNDCLEWLAAHDLPSPGKSACHFCPYHSKAAWQELKREGGEDWQRAIEIDEAIRHKRPGFQSFVHSSRIPLTEAVSIPEDVGAMQTAFDLDNAPCDSGHCFL